MTILQKEGMERCPYLRESLKCRIYAEMEIKMKLGIGI